MSKSRLQFQTLTTNGWVNDVQVALGTSDDDYVYRLTTKNSLTLTAIGKIEERTGVSCLERKTTGNRTYSIEGLPMLVPYSQGNISALRQLFFNGSVGNFFIPSRIKAYTSVDRSAYESIGTDEDSFWLNFKQCVLKKDTSPRIQALGAQYCRWYIQQWNLVNHGIFATNDKSAAELQAILLMTGVMSRIKRTVIQEVVPFSTDAWKPDLVKSIPDVQTQLLYDKNGVYVHALRREIYSGVIFVL